MPRNAIKKKTVYFTNIPGWLTTILITLALVLKYNKQVWSDIFELSIFSFFD